MADTAAELERGRAAYAGRAWSDAHTSLTQVDQLRGLNAPDLELLATAAYMLGRDDEFVTLLERAHHAHLRDERTAARRPLCVLAGRSSLRPAAISAVASGWLGRAQRLLENKRGGRLRRAGLHAHPVVAAADGWWGLGGRTGATAVTAAEGR